MEADPVLGPCDLFDLSDDLEAQLFRGCEFVWDALPTISVRAAELVGDRPSIDGSVAPSAVIEGAVHVARGAVVEPFAYIKGPCWIGPAARIRQGAYVRGDVIMLPGSLLGHAGEAKNAILLSGARAPHFAYLGDSILGREVNLGAGTKLSNLPITSFKNVDGERPKIDIVVDGVTYRTGVSKFGGILGDRSQTGCNVVLNPGTILGPDCLVYPNVTLRKGAYPARSIVKLRQELEIARLHEEVRE